MFVTSYYLNSNKKAQVYKGLSMQKVLCLIGPTAIGKTSLSIQLAKTWQAEIISGDSMQVYREVQVGTARPTKAEMAGIKHYLVGTRSIFDNFDVTDFVKSAQSAISEIAAHNKLPLVVGGTGFYLKALLYNLQLGEKGAEDSSISPRWQKFLAQKGPEALWDELNQADPAAADKIPWQNTRRVLRALTVIERTGQLFSKQQPAIEPRYDFLILGLNTDRSQVYDRINRRVDLMLEQGLLPEAEFVYQHRADIKQAGQAIGYKEFFPYFAGESNLPACIAQLKQASRRYAKRQLTYFRHQLPVTWFDPFQPGFETAVDQAVKNWLRQG
jgi:tRNA dimethylallyltransferase